MKSMQIRRWIARTMAAASLVAGMALVAVTPAHAATGNVYLVTPRWWGWCPGGDNYVTWVSYAVSSVSSGGDGGDDIVYAKVILNQAQDVVMGVQCKKTLPQGSSTSITPTRSGQTFFMGFPSGSWTSG